jgi:hypothetical protein
LSLWTRIDRHGGSQSAEITDSVKKRKRLAVGGMGSPKAGFKYKIHLSDIS